MAETDLNNAMLQGKWNLVNTLLDNDADPNVVGNNGRNALHVAVMTCDDRGVFQEILGKIHNINAVDNKGNTALIIASMLGLYQEVEDIMGVAGVDTSHTNNAGLSALDYAHQIENLDKRQKVMDFLVPRRSDSRLMGLKNTLRF